MAVFRKLCFKNKYGPMNTIKNLMTSNLTSLYGPILSHLLKGATAKCNIYFILKCFVYKLSNINLALPNFIKKIINKDRKPIKSKGLQQMVNVYVCMLSM